MTVNILRHSERSEESILLKTIFDYCFTPCRSFRFAIRKTFIHFFGATSDWVRLTRRPTQNLSWISFSKNSRSFRNRSHSLCFSLLRTGFVITHTASYTKSAVLDFVSQNADVLFTSLPFSLHFVTSCLRFASHYTKSAVQNDDKIFCKIRHIL